MPSLEVKDFATLFGTNVSALPEKCLELIAEGDWSYEAIEGAELDNVLRGFLNRIEQEDFSIVKLGDKSRWMRGWAENREDFVASKGDLASLAPKYIRSNSPVRLFRQFVRPSEQSFELKWYRVFQEWLFRTYLSEADTIFEFGSGSGINVGLLAQMYPQKKIIGLDWAEPACNIIDDMHRLHGWSTEGRLFDFFEPDESVDIPQGSVVLTIGALEQTANKHNDFIDFLIARKPALCVFIEPIYEWYDPKNLADHLAIRAHNLRNFWKGFPERLRQLEIDGKVEILKKKRSEFGSIVLEGYSQIIWRPL